MIRIQVTVREGAERNSSGQLVNEGTVIQTYILPAKTYDIVLPIYEEARQVWDEYDVEFNGIGFPFKLVTMKTYKEELMHRQWLLDLHEEVSGEE